MGRRYRLPMVFLFEKRLWVTLTTAFFFIKTMARTMALTTRENIKRIFVLVLLAVLILFSHPSVSYAASAGDQAREQYRIARSLEKKGNYYDAITEYKRFLFFLTEDRRAPDVLYRLTYCYYKVRDWGNTVKYAREFEKKYPSSLLFQKIKLLEAKALINDGKPEAALGILLDFQKHEGGVSTAFDKELTALMGRCYVLEGQFEKAKASAGNDVESVNFHSKNSALAGISAALIPGMGHIYDGRLRDAWTAFFYTGFLSAITWEAVKNENLWLAGMFGTAAATFYAGNVFSAVNMAEKHNRKAKMTMLANYFLARSGDTYVEFDSTPIRQPEVKTANTDITRREKRRSLFSWMFLAGISTFRKIVSPIDNRNCPSYPACSSYGLQAYKKYGPFWGTMLTLDRLIHEPSEARLSPYIIIKGRRKIYDPLEANDFLLR